MNKRSERGQILILLLLIVLVVLTVVLAIAERSTSSLSNSDKTDQSSRAFAAAEAGVEAFQSGGICATPPCPLSNQSQSSYSINGSLNVAYPGPGEMLEYPKIGKETVAQFWLVDPTSLLPVSGGVGNLLTLYFGNNDPGDPPLDLTSPTSNAVALDVDLVSRDGSGNYTSHKLLYDPDNVRGSNTGLTSALYGIPSCGGFSETTELGSNRNFACRVNMNMTTIVGSDTPILMRVRILYTNEKQALALAPTLGLSLPLQAILFTSTGTSGNSIQKIQVFQVPNVVTPFMDYALFSYGDFSK